MITFALIALVASALFSALQLQRSAEKLADEPKVTLQAASLSALFIGVAALAELLLDNSDIDLQTLQRMLSNLAYYAALPLLASAIIVTARNDHWSRPAWGRWLIGLFALFELLRRMEHGELYTQILAVAISVAVLYATIIQSNATLRRTALLITLNLSLALLLFGPGSLLPEHSSPFLYPVLLAATLPLIASGLKLGTLSTNKKA